MSKSLRNKELESFRKNFVENLRAPMRNDFRRVVAAIADLEHQLEVVREQWQQWQPTPGGPTWWTPEFEAVVRDMPLDVIRKGWKE